MEILFLLIGLLIGVIGGSLAGNTFGRKSEYKRLELERDNSLLQADEIVREAQKTAEKNLAHADIEAKQFIIEIL